MLRENPMTGEVLNSSLNEKIKIKSRNQVIELIRHITVKNSKCTVKNIVNKAKENIENENKRLKSENERLVKSNRKINREIEDEKKKLLYNTGATAVIGAGTFAVLSFFGMPYLAPVAMVAVPVVMDMLK